jgi:hypothetical protein
MLHVSTYLHPCLPLLHMLLSRQSLKTRGGFVLIVFSIFAAGPCQLWKAENRARLGALLGFTGSAPMVSSPYSPFPHATQVPSPSFTPGTPDAESPRLPAQYTTRSSPTPAAPPLGGKPITSVPQLAGSLLDYSFNTTPVAVVQVMRFPWEVVLTDPHKFHVHRVVDPEEKHPPASVHVLAVRAQGPYVAVWIADPGMLLEAEEAPRSYRFQLAILPGAVTRAEDGRPVTVSTHAFSVSEQSVSEDLLFLDMMTPEHTRVSGTKATQPSGPEATRALFLVGIGLDFEAPPTPLARIVARREREPQHATEFFGSRCAIRGVKPRAANNATQPTFFLDPEARGLSTPRRSHNGCAHDDQRGSMR